MLKMKKTLLAGLNLIGFFLIISINAKNGITFRVTGRLGDNLMAYCQHKWLAHTHNLDLYVPHFRYKEFFGVITSENGSVITNKYRSTTVLHSETEIVPSYNQHIYQSSFYMHLKDINNNDELGDYLFRKSIEDPTYGSAVQKALALPTIKSHIKLPNNRVSVAIHIRKGCGDDYPLYSKQYERDPHDLPQDKIYSDKHHCLKFPPEQFYAEQLEKLYMYLDEKPLYVFIFSDDKSPEKLVKRIKQYLGNRCDITFDTKKSNTTDPASILTDILDMSMCEYLIRSESHFPWIAQMIGKHNGIIRPVGFAWEDTYLKITRTLLDIPRRAEKMVETIEF